jgi:hypothetical protein
VIITSGRDEAPDLPGVTILHDEAEAFLAAYGRAPEYVCLVRPDGYIAYLASPLRAKEVRGALRRGLGTALRPRMKIATFNINNIRKRLPNLLDWMRETSPDVVCLQELKATDAEFPVGAIREEGYEAIWRGQKTWNGVAILSRTKPIETLRELPGDPDDNQSRYIEAAFGRAWYAR